MAKVHVLTMTGRVMSHALKHPTRDKDSREIVDRGPVTMSVLLSDDVGREVKAEFIVPKGFEPRWPVGAMVTMHANVKQQEIDFMQKDREELADATEGTLSRAGVELSFEVPDEAQR